MKKKQSKPKVKKTKKVSTMNRKILTPDLAFAIEDLIIYYYDVEDGIDWEEMDGLLSNLRYSFDEALDKK